jgi:hypothetical protein
MEVSVPVERVMKGIVREVRESLSDMADVLRDGRLDVLRCFR